MRQLDKILKMSAAERKQVRANVARMLKANPSNMAAREMDLAFEEYDRSERRSARLNSTGLLWDPHPNGVTTSYCYLNGEIVASIWKRENHNGSNDGVYFVTVLGTKMEKSVRHVGDARRLAEAKYRTRSEY